MGGKMPWIDLERFCVIIGDQVSHCSFCLGTVCIAHCKNFMSLGNVIIQGLTAEAFATGFAAHVIEGRTFYTYLVSALGPRMVKTIRKILKDI